MVQVRILAAERAEGMPMCAMCQPSAYEQVMADLADTVETYGWAVRAVYGEGARPPWAYTVGLHAQDLPELVVTGLPAEEAVSLLNDGAERLLDGLPAAPFGTGYELVELPHPDVHLLQATALFGPAFRAVQLVWADERGRWPWDPGFAGRQPVLGPRR
jgi:hypothetical protein